MINKHGLKIKGLKKAAGDTKDYRISPYGCALELFYNTTTGECWTVMQANSYSTWTIYSDPDIWRIGTLTQRYTMQDLADIIYDTIIQVQKLE